MEIFLNGKTSILAEEYFSPCGKLLIGVCGEAVVLCDWDINDRVRSSLRRIKRFSGDHDSRSNPYLLESAKLKLDEYFAGNLKYFDLPLCAFGTPFQLRVWELLRSVEYGKTMSYKSVAEEVGYQAAVRAVANAVGANPLSLLIPCHRIIGSSGSLTGYAGGLEAKRYLLDLEQSHQQSCLLAPTHRQEEMKR